MAKSISWKVFVEKFAVTTTLLDVRSPGEFFQGSVPGAFNLPLFDNEERAHIGTLYKQSGPEEALLSGLELVGPKLAPMLRKVKNLAGENRQIAVHCWRGGMRSASVAQLLEAAGYEVSILRGGYKAYRNFVLDYIAQPWKLRILGGRTGSGKTGILLAMKALGAQVIDLEGLANHKGSAFGHLLEAPQPAQQNFEHALFNAFRACDPSQPIWLEDESISIGKIYIPKPLWEQMRKAPLAVVEMSTERRLRQLEEDYAEAPIGELYESLEKIKKRLGGQHVKAAREALEAQDYKEAARIALNYYDRAYDRGLEKKSELVRWKMHAGESSFEEIAREILVLTASDFNTGEESKASQANPTEKVPVRIPLSIPNIGRNEWPYVKQCLDTGWLSSAGGFVGEFEKKNGQLDGSSPCRGCFQRHSGAPPDAPPCRCKTGGFCNSAQPDLRCQRQRDPLHWCRTIAHRC